MVTNHYTTREILNPKDAFAFETITICASSRPLTSTTYLDAIIAYGTLEGGEIRVRTDGGAATSTTGHLIEVNDSFLLENPHQIMNFRAHTACLCSGTIQISYYT